MNFRDRNLTKDHTIEHKTLFQEFNNFHHLPVFVARYYLVEVERTD